MTRCRISVNVADVPLPVLGAVGRAVEDAGFDGLFLGDHVVTMSAGSSPYPYAVNAPTFERDAPRADALVALGHLAATTSRITLGTAVLVAPLRHPVLLGRAAACIQELSGGRLVLGLGAGWLDSEFTAMGVPFERRGHYLDEMLDVLPRLLRGEVVSHQGEAYDIPTVELTPVPPSIPILVGGHGPVAMRRAARADGWFAPPVPLEPTLELTRRLEAEREQVDRTDRPFTTVVRLPPDADLQVVDQYRRAGFDDLAISPFRSGIVNPRGTADQIRDALASLSKGLGIDGN